MCQPSLESHKHSASEYVYIAITELFVGNVVWKPAWENMLNWADTFTSLSDAKISNNSSYYPITKADLEDKANTSVSLRESFIEAFIRRAIKIKKR